MIRRAVIGAWALCSVLSVACGGSDGNGNPAAPTPPVQQPFSQTVPGSVLAFGETRHALTIPRSGNLTLVLTWADATVDLDLYIAPSTCVALYPMPGCGVLAGSVAAPGVLREQLARAVTVGENFSVWVDNLHPSVGQPYTIDVTIQ